MIARDRDEALGLLEFIDASPSPFHAVNEAAALLGKVGFSALDEAEAWADAGEGRWFVRRGGSLVAWTAGAAEAPSAGFRIVGAHTDSPNLRVKPAPDTGRAGFRQLGVEIYGGALLNSWLDRDLGLSGRVTIVDDGSPVERLLKLDRPLLRVPQLAIHLDRDVNDRGLQLNPQQHLVPVWGLGRPDPGDFTAFLAGELSVEPSSILGWDLMAHDLTPGSLLGADNELISAPRLDDLCSVYTALRALLRHLDAGPSGPHVPVVCLFDHEEVGSTTDRGADSTMLATILERSVLARGGQREDLHRALAASVCVSADMAHATHPNYTDRHDPEHWIALNGGPVLKVNARARYATDATGAAVFAHACAEAGVPMQRFVNRTDLPCGSTIGPITAARLGVPTVDVGLPQLAMHSARELAGADDPAHMVRALTVFFSAPLPRAA